MKKVIVYLAEATVSMKVGILRRCRSTFVEKFGCNDEC